MKQSASGSFLLPEALLICRMRPARPGVPFYYRRSLRQYWVQSLSVHSQHCSAALEYSQNRSGYIITHSSHTSHAAAAMRTSERA